MAAKKSIIESTITRQREFFNSGVTLDPVFRMERLMRLREVILGNKGNIYEALMEDLRKPKMEAYASEIAFEAANQAIQIHGGYGYVREFPVEKLLRDVKLNQIYEGTNEIQRLIIARHILAE